VSVASNSVTLDQMRDSYDWGEVFKYASNTSPQFSNPGKAPTAVPGFTGSTDPFTLDDVEDVIASVDGENDGPSWVAIVRLKDQRYAAIEAGCDYTGWG
jgi:hypothetical protein